ncbi:hypothetical protein EDB85DRAFT_1489920 [Lactarius pseudohatsudake]|nr:hypothetical protein EDB85DRAFT_1489920 [Lactarius pseudohatsudake]
MRYSRRGRCEGHRGSLSEGGGARPGEAVRHRGKPRRFPHHAPRRTVPGHVHRGGAAQPGHQLSALEHGHPRLVLLRVRRAPVGRGRAYAARALCAALPGLADRARAQRARARPAPPWDRGPPGRQRAGQGVLPCAARAGEVELLAFEGDGHALDGVEATGVGWEPSTDWFGRKA